MANTDWHKQLGLEYPIVQAGMGGGLSTSRLANAVSNAGALGTVGLSSPATFAQELVACQVNNKPFAANLLMPFYRRAHLDVCLKNKPSVAVMFLGFNRGLVLQLKQAGIRVWHQVGSLEEAHHAMDDGVDGLIVQGVEAGGHSAGDEPLVSLFPKVREHYPNTLLLAAGGIYNAETARQAMLLGADGVVAGTRFLLTHETDAHQDYVNKLLAADTTLRTQLFGLAWPAWHRVVPNKATDKWCQHNAKGNWFSRSVHTLSVPLRKVMPMNTAVALSKLQKPSIPLFSPAGKTRDMDGFDVEASALYAGKNVVHINQLLSVKEVVEELATGII